MPKPIRGCLKRQTLGTAPSFIRGMRAPRPAAMQERRTVAVQKAGLPGGLHRALRVQRHPGRAAGVPGQAAVLRVGKQAYSTRSSLWMS